MAEREKVIRGLELCAYDPDPGQELKEIRSCPECPYYRAGCSPQLIRDALALLKEKEPKLLTLEEVEKSEEWMWVEYVSGYCGWQRPDKEDDYLNMVAWNDATFDRKDYYGKTWRCWTARLTEEQRKAVKWNV